MIPLAFFFVRVPDIIGKLKNKNCHLEQDVNQFLYSTMDGQKCENKQHGDTVTEKRVAYFYVIYISKLKNLT